MQGMGKKHTPHTTLRVCLFFLALPLQFVAQVCAVSFKVFVGELYFGEIRCRNSSVIVMLFSCVFQSLLK